MAGIAAAGALPRPAPGMLGETSPALDALVRAVAHPDMADLSMRQAALLAVLRTAPEPERHVKRLAARLAVNKPAITRGMDRLEELKFARRQADRTDKRNCICVITPPGRAWLRRLEGAVA